MSRLEENMDNFIKSYVDGSISVLGDNANIDNDDIFELYCQMSDCFDIFCEKLKAAQDNVKAHPYEPEDFDSLFIDENDGAS